MRHIFRRNAFLLICKMLEMTTHTREDTSELVDEILHSLFFLGKILRPACSPRELLDDDDDDIYDYLMEAHPEPFRLYSSQLPRRSPFSCVLDMVVHLEGQEKEDAIRMTLHELTCELMKQASTKVLFSTTICVSHGSNKDSRKHYGASMSTTGRPAGQILVAASCLSFWDEYVADAVMSYYPEKTRKEYFDVTIQFPANVNCRAFNLRSGGATNPCLSCKNMFDLDSAEKQQWAYGNCAEVECLSNLLREKEVKDTVQRIGNWTEENRERARNYVLNHLKFVLKGVGFAWDNSFYTPQRVRAENGELDE